MAKTEQIVITDDITGDKDAETVQFALDGIPYTIDLSPKNQEKLRAALAPFVAKAERIKGATPAKRADYQQRAERYRRMGQVRQWAKEQGIPLGDRGRIPKLVLAQYDAVHG